MAWLFPRQRLVDRRHQHRFQVLLGDWADQFVGDAAVGALEAAAADADAEVRLHAVSALGQLSEVADQALARVAGGTDGVAAQVAARFVARRGSTATA